MSSQAIKIQNIESKKSTYPKIKTISLKQFQSKIINGDIIQELTKLNKNYKW